MKEHDLKCWTEYFDAVARGAKTCEVRVDDRDYDVGDVILLRDYDRAARRYLDRELRLEITHIARAPFVPVGLCVMSFRMIGSEPKIAELTERVELFEIAAREVIADLEGGIDPELDPDEVIAPLRALLESA